MYAINKSEAELRLERIQHLKSLGLNPYPPDFQRSCRLIDIHQDFHHVDAEGQEINLTLCGRIMNIRRLESTVLIDVNDQDSKLRFVLEIDEVGTAMVENFKRCVFEGDFVGFNVRRIFRTSTGEFAALAYKWIMLAPCVVPLPWRVKAPEHQRQQRYLYLAVDPVARRQFTDRSKMIRQMRRFLEENYDFLEVKTPASSRAKKRGSSNESYFKQLIIGGLEAVYEIADSYSDENDWSRSLEYQTLRCSMSPADIDDMMSLTERMINELATELRRSHFVAWISPDQMKKLAEQKNKRTLTTDDDSDFPDSSDITDTEVIMIDLMPPWPRRSFYEIVLETTGVNFQRLSSIEEAITAAKSLGVHFETTCASIGGIALKVAEELVYPTLTRPTFVVDIPSGEYLHAKYPQADSTLNKRAELFINGIKFAKICIELTDPCEQERVRQLQNPKRNHQDMFQPDDNFLTALKYGLPPTGSLVLGVDRLVMLLTGATDIHDVIFFPSGH